MQSLSIWHSFIIAILISACVARAVSLYATAINKRTLDDRSVKDRSSVVPVTGASGFGGWLALVTIGVFVSPPVTIVKMLGINSGFENFDFQAFWFMLDGDIGIHLTVIFMQICTAVFMVLRSKRFVSVYIVTSICMILLLPTEIIWLSSMLYWKEGMRLQESLPAYASPEIIGRWIFSSVGIGVWMLYVIRSRRVANTFVR
jgi:hypothetical protein